MSAKQNMEDNKKEDTAEDWWYNYGQFAGDAFNEVKDYFSNSWKELKRAGSKFVDGFSNKTTGKSFQSNADAAKKRINQEMINFDDYIEEKTGKDVQGHVDSLLGSPTTPQSGVAAKPIVYSDWSPAAQRFGMDQETAYAEHMANTAHQREVADLRAAGLNPVLGAGSGSSGVSGSVAGISSGKKGIDGESLVDIIGATAGLVTTLVSKKPYLGYMVSDVVKKAGDVI